MNSKFKASTLMRMLAMMGISMNNSQVPKYLKEIDISKEYELIMQKKSKLSASQRRVVIRLYENSIKEM